MSGTGSSEETSGMDMRSAIADAIQKNEISTADTPTPEIKDEPAAPAKEVVDDKAAVQAEKTEPQDKALEPHANWSKEAKDRFGKLDKDSQAFLLDRERSMQADYTRKTQEIAALKRDYEPVDQIFKPYRDQMKAAGHTPESLIKGWASVETALMGGKGIDVIKGLVQGYKLNPQEIIAALTGNAPAQANNQNAPQQQQNSPVALPPELQAKLSKIDQFEQRFAADDQARQAQETAKVMQSIEDFKSAKDDKGNALHPHFDELEADMALMAQALKASGKVPTLKELYERTVYANPSTREKVLAAERQSEENRKNAEARAKAEKARKASSSVTGSSKDSGQSQANGRDKGMSLRDQIAQSYQEVSS